MGNTKTDWQAQLTALFHHEDLSFFHAIKDYLLELGYQPQKEKVPGLVLRYRHPKHKAIMAKFGIRDEGSQELCFSLRFAASQVYAPKYGQSIRDQYVGRKTYHKCYHCGHCGPAPVAYACEEQDGDITLHCGVYTIPILRPTPDDVPEIKRLIQIQHEYFLQNG